MSKWNIISISGGIIIIGIVLYILYGLFISEDNGEDNGNMFNHK